VVNTGEPTPEVVWLKEKKLIKKTKDKRVNVEFDEATNLSVLTITGATAEDSGEYTVQLANEV